VEFTSRRTVVAYIAAGICALTPIAGAMAQSVQDVYPVELQGTRPFELGELVLLLMPDSGVRPVGWDFRAESPILWRTVGYETVQRKGASLYIRNGIVRAHIQGKKSTVLRQRVVELGWGVKYSSTINPNFGPQEITIEPGPPREPCFGSTYTGCDFEEPLSSLAQAGIAATKLCGKRGTGDIVSAFSLTHAGRRPTVMVWETSGGSGGSSAWLTLKLNETPNPGICDKLL
jgi:hypothetical protein